MLAVLGDSVTTDHISPAGSIPADSPAGKYLIAQGVKPGDFNSYGARRGNHEVMMRGTFANIRLRNQLAPGTEGGWTAYQPEGGPMTIYDASMAYQAAGVPLLVLAGKEYGSGSSRDWAAKGTLLLGVRAVIAESFERIHRSNLVNMGVLPLQFRSGESAGSLGLTGDRGLRHRAWPACTPRATIAVRVRPPDGHGAGDSGAGAHRHAGRAHRLPARRHSSLRAAATGGQDELTDAIIRGHHPTRSQEGRWPGSGPLLILGLMSLAASSYLAAQEPKREELSQQYPGTNPHLNNKESIRGGMSLYRRLCGECHGLDATGYRGPNLLAYMAGAGDEAMFQTIRKGVPGSEMPAVHPAR